MYSKLYHGTLVNVVVDKRDVTCVWLRNLPLLLSIGETFPPPEAYDATHQFRVGAWYPSEQETKKDCKRQYIAINKRRGRKNLFKDNLQLAY